ncbi:MAG: DUF2723 domain-containing protein [Anaerolineales bacterium]|nr:DUF2723 domain-containing protein [Anaerolineales bacterium]
MVKSEPRSLGDRQLAIIITALAAGLLLRNVAPGILPGDAGEFQVAAWQWGLAHPTGYPLYLIAGGLWQHLLALFGISPAYALNALSALIGGVTVGLFYWLAVHWLPGMAAIRRLAAVFAAAMLLANPTLRSQSAQAEVYTLHLLFIVGLLLVAQNLARAERPAPRLLILFALITGLSLTHHATTILLLPPLLAYLFMANRSWWRPARAWLWAVLAFLAPFLLYLYVPLRSGPAASPWYHQRFGDGTLSLYDGSLQAFLDFVTGRSISVGFYDAPTALSGIPTALLLWLRHFEWSGVVLIVIGIVFLVRARNWPMLVLTVGYAVLQQVFNLFYGIGDIFVYYLPLYLVGCLWAGFGAAGFGDTFYRMTGAHEQIPKAEVTPATMDHAVAPIWTYLLMVLLFYIPVSMWMQYTPLLQQLHDESLATRAAWDAILLARPPEDAILVSNDRNEIAPLFYLQHVEGAGASYTGLFPLIAPGERFADIGATVQSALDEGGTQPVFLIKPMPGLEARFALQPATPPLVEVTGVAAGSAPSTPVNAPYGPLTLLGYDWVEQDGQVQVDLRWRVEAPLAADYTTTVQVFDQQGGKLGQDDRRPGGEYYPTSRWKPGEVLIDSHTIALTPGAPVRLLVGLYTGPDATLMAPALELELEP